MTSERGLYSMKAGVARYLMSESGPRTIWSFRVDNSNRIAAGTDRYCLCKSFSCPIRAVDAIAARTENIHQWNKKHALNHAIHELNKHSNTIFDTRILRALSVSALEAI